MEPTCQWINKVINLGDFHYMEVKIFLEEARAGGYSGNTIPFIILYKPPIPHDRPLFSLH